MQFSYDVIDIRELDARQLLESDSVGDNLLAILCKVDDIHQVSRRILKRLATLPGKQAQDALAKLLILSKLRRAQKIIIEEAKKMITFTYDELEEMDIPGFADAMLSAEKRGKKLGGRGRKEETCRSHADEIAERQFRQIASLGKTDDCRRRFENSGSMDAARYQF